MKNNEPGPEIFLKIVFLVDVRMYSALVAGSYDQQATGIR